MSAATCSGHAWVELIGWLTEEDELSTLKFPFLRKQRTKVTHTLGDTASFDHGFRMREFKHLYSIEWDSYPFRFLEPVHPPFPLRIQTTVFMGITLSNIC